MTNIENYVAQEAQRHGRETAGARARACRAGDETRVSLVTQHSKGRPHSITQLTEGSKLTSFTASGPVARAYSNLIRSRLDRFRNASSAFPSGGT
jgi:hypothetical protein